MEGLTLFTVSRDFFFLSFTEQFQLGVTEDGLRYRPNQEDVKRFILLYFTEKATDGSLQSEDWTLNMEICDIINETEEGYVLFQQTWKGP